MSDPSEERLPGWRAFPGTTAAAMVMFAVVTSTGEVSKETTERVLGIVLVPFFVGAWVYVVVWSGRYRRRERAGPLVGAIFLLLLAVLVLVTWIGFFGGHYSPHHGDTKSDWQAGLVGSSIVLATSLGIHALVRRAGNARWRRRREAFRALAANLDGGELLDLAGCTRWLASHRWYSEVGTGLEEFAVAGHLHGRPVLILVETRSYSDEDSRYPRYADLYVAAQDLPDDIALHPEADGLRADLTDVVVLQFQPGGVKARLDERAVAPLLAEPPAFTSLLALASQLAAKVSYLGR